MSSDIPPQRAPKKAKLAKNKARRYHLTKRNPPSYKHELLPDDIPYYYDEDCVSSPLPKLMLKPILQKGQRLPRERTIIKNFRVAKLNQDLRRVTAHKQLPMHRVRAMEEKMSARRAASQSGEEGKLRPPPTFKPSASNSEPPPTFEPAAGPPPNAIISSCDVLAQPMAGASEIGANVEGALERIQASQREGGGQRTVRAGRDEDECPGAPRKSSPPALPASTSVADSSAHD